MKAAVIKSAKLVINPFSVFIHQYGCDRANHRLRYIIAKQESVLDMEIVFYMHLRMNGVDVEMAISTDQASSTEWE